jgi:hypothetical protein
MIIENNDITVAILPYGSSRDITEDSYEIYYREDCIYKGKLDKDILNSCEIQLPKELDGVCNFIIEFWKEKDKRFWDAQMICAEHSNVYNLNTVEF